MASFETRITRILDDSGIQYRLLFHSEPVFSVETAAAQRGVNARQMVKSILLCDRDGHRVMACVPGLARLDTRAVRDHLPPEWRRLRFATAEEILEVTGCVLGAVAPVGLPENVPVIFDQAIARCEKVNISSGDPIAGLELAPEDLIRISGAVLAPIIQAD